MSYSLINFSFLNLGRNETILSSSNVQKDDDFSLPLLWTEPDEENVLIHRILNSVTDISGSDEQQEDFENDFDEMRLDALENLAGFIIKKCRKYINPDIAVNNEINNYSWVDEISEGGLIKPSKLFLNEIYKLEKIFENINNNTIRVQSNYLKNLISLATNVNLPMKAKELFFRCRTYFRIKNLNNSACSIKLNKRKNKKNKKICT